MSDAVVTPTEGASVVVDSGSKPVAAPAAAAKPDEKPAWLDERLARERAKALKDAGFESEEAAKKAAEQLRAIEDQKKTDAQKLAEFEANLKAERESKKGLADALSGYAQAQMKALTDAQREAVAAVAGDDPAKQLKTIEALRPTWASAAAPAAVAEQAKPRDTAAAPAMPKDGAPTGAPDMKAIHDELKKTNPVLASRYALANGLFESK